VLVADVGATDVALVGLYLVLLALPGAAVGLAGGLRGWVLAAAAPLLTYAVVGLAGPWTTALGVPRTAAAAAAATAVAALALLAVRLAAARARRPTRPPEPAAVPVRAEPPGRPASDGPPGPPAPDAPAPWPVTAHVAVAATVAGAAATGAATVLGGIDRLSTVPQDWDAVFHANGVRWISDTGDASLLGMGRVNWYVEGTEVFHPNAYHLLASVVHQVTGRDIPSVLNAHTVLIPGLAALVLAAVVRRFGGRPLHAAGAAAAVALASAVYDLLWRGPLLPYATGVAMTAVAVLLVVEFLDAASARSPGAPPRGALLAVGAAGLVCVHSSAVFGAALLTLPYLAWRWTRHPDRLGREPLLLALAGLGAAGLASMQLAGAVYSATSYPPLHWAAELAWYTAAVELVTGAHEAPGPQIALTVAVVAGALGYRRLGELRWVGGAALLVGALFVLTAGADVRWVNDLTRPWWNDRWRLAGLFAIPLCLLAGHGVAQAQAAGARLARRVLHRPAPRRAVSVAVGAAVLGGLAVVDDGLGVTRNIERMERNVGERPLSPADVDGIRALAAVAPPGVRVLNDRGDGTAWVYALGGVLPVAGHYDGTNLAGTAVALLQDRFRDYDSDPEVRAAVDELNVRYVILSDTFVFANGERRPGLRGLSGADFLEVVHSADGVVVYRIVDPTDRTNSREPDAAR
jgi:hypothetical protein